MISYKFSVIVDVLYILESFLLILIISLIPCHNLLNFVFIFFEKFTIVVWFT